jgi:hypothetical protein
MKPKLYKSVVTLEISYNTKNYPRRWNWADILVSSGIGFHHPVKVRVIPTPRKKKQHRSATNLIK